MAWLATSWSIDSTLPLYRCGYGVLLLATLLWCLPSWRRFFLAERWGGYTKNTPVSVALQNPFVFSVLFAAWILAALALIAGEYVLPAALYNVVLCRYLFIQRRWSSILRGMGAPGFISYWTGIAILLLEYSRAFCPEILPLTLFVIQTDLGVIILSSGYYKYRGGYLQNEGMEYGMVNPEWGYFWRQFRRFPAYGAVFRFLNQSAWSTEIAAAIMMLLPGVKAAGGLLLIMIFAFVATQIRLAFLCEMMMLNGILYFSSAGDVPADLLAHLSNPWAGLPMLFLLSLYLLLLPFAYGGMAYNFYARKRFNSRLQWLLERYTNFFGMILWRVFSIDVLDFYIEVFEVDPSGNRVRHLNAPGWSNFPRFGHVAESITLTSLFTTRKYYPENFVLFEERLLRYCATLPIAPGNRLQFDYVRVRKEDGRFTFPTAVSYEVDGALTTVRETLLDPEFSFARAHQQSLVFSSAQPGTYAPRGADKDGGSIRSAS